ncbi:MAG TPA: FAD-dependent oxidoreductase [Chitinophagaceae bacterium]
MEFDYIIIGQGICGTFLSWNLLKAGKKIIVIDESQPFSSTKVASGIINPVTGRRVVATWMIEKLLPFAWDEYTAIGKDIDELVIEQKNTIAFSPSQQMFEAYNKRANEANTYIQQLAETGERYHQWFNFIYPAYIINPTYLIYLHPLLNGWRKKLIEINSLLEEKFDVAQLIIQQGYVEYKNITAAKIFFCNGVNTFQNPYWKNLPYVFNKGQALIADIPLLPSDCIYKYGTATLTPWYNNLWWIGSSYENDFVTTVPTEDFYKNTVASLKNILKIPFTINDHFSALRPAVIERRPFVGLHPNYAPIGIFNGMGTKGCSLAPYFAHQLTHYLLNNIAIDTLVDVKRFSGILSYKN